jgi:hypothetical protein
MKRHWWLISVGGYGSFGFYGTEGEAEEMRAHKARWEQGAGKKERIPATHPEAKSEQEHLRRQLANGYPLDDRQLAAIGAARS